MPAAHRVRCFWLTLTRLSIVVVTAASVLLLEIAPAHAFECDKVTLPSSLVICADPELQAIADERQQVYGALWARLDPDQQKALRADQNRWVRDYATACGASPDLPPPLPPTPSMIECFKRAGLAWTVFLRGYSTGPTSAATASPGPGPTAGARDRIGPSFKCAPGQDALAQIICSDSDLSELDLLFVQSYQAIRNQLDEEGQQALRVEANDFHNSILQDCGIPRTALVAQPDRFLECVKPRYLKQRASWLSRVVGPAAEEANRPIGEHLALQQKLQNLGFLPTTAEVDGVYGPATRAAISAWQVAQGKPPTGFLSNADADTLGRQEAPTAQPSPGATAAGHSVRLERQGSVYVVPVLINRAITLKFILDSGASDVLIPADVFRTLVRTGTVSESDLIGSKTYSLADGSKLQGTQFIIRELMVGSEITRNVVASVGPATGDLLLGLSFLSRFGSVTLDNDQHVLILSGNPDVRSSGPQGRDKQVKIPATPETALAGNRHDQAQPSIPPERSRYRLADCGSIIDRSTNLEWYVGPDVNMTWSEANKWAQVLGVCQGRWATPSIEQIKTLFDPNQTAGTGYYTRGRYWPAHIDPVFSQIGKGSWVWTYGAADSLGAPAFNFNQGIAVRLSPANKEYTTRAFAVKPASE